VDQHLLVFASIIYEALPFIVVGVVLAGLLEEFVPQQGIAKIVPRNRVLAIAIGGFLGLVFPMCECGIIPVMRRLLRKGLPLSLCVTYMLAGPIINIVVMWSTKVAFDYPRPEERIFGGPWNMVLLRVGFGFLVAFNVGLLVEWLSRKPDVQLLSPLVLRGLNQADEEGAARPTFRQRLDNITGTALNDFVDIMVFLILGAGLAAVGRALVQNADFENAVKDPPVAILIMMGVAVLFCLCSEADAFVAANFPAIFPPASKLAFLVLGPMMDIKLYLMYTRVFRPRLIWTIIIAVAVQVFVYMLVLHYLGEAGLIPYQGQAPATVPSRTI
jgi:uncharacterized membrane protein YraQ (UPF0718 family)